MDRPLLDSISSPQDLKKLAPGQLPQLCEEIRSFLIESVSQTGGHLSSNLGTIELIVAFHRVFQTPVDKILFDVGHQCYTHKLLTGRREGFAAALAAAQIVPHRASMSGRVCTVPSST